MDHTTTPAMIAGTGATDAAHRAKNKIRQKGDEL